MQMIVNNIPVQRNTFNVNVHIRICNILIKLKASIGQLLTYSEREYIVIILLYYNLFF